MVVAFDNNVLCLLLHPEADVPADPKTGRPIERVKARMDFLVETLRNSEARILLATPVLSEFLTFASPEYLVTIRQSGHFEIAPFDERAAIEAAVALKRAVKSPQGKKLGLAGSWQKIKIDRQIVAIAKVEGAEAIYTSDPDVAALAIDSGLQAIHPSELPLPPSDTPLLDSVLPDDEAPEA